MVSSIDVTKPVYGNPTTASVRANFATAANEISALQAAMSGGTFLPLTGGTLTGALTLASGPVNALHAATKAYVDAAAPAGGPYLPLSGGVMTGPIQMTQATNPHVIMSGSTPGGLPSIYNAGLIVAAESGSGQLRVVSMAFNQNNHFTGVRAQGNKTAPTALIANIAIANFNHLGFDGADWVNGGAYTQNTANAWSPTDRSMLHRWTTTAPGSIIPINAMMLDPNGILLLGNNFAAAVGTSKLQVTGGALVDTLTIGQTIPVSSQLSIVGPDAVATNITIQGAGTGSNPQIVGRRSGGTFAAPVPGTASILLGLSAYGYGASGWSAGARANIFLRSGETWTDTAQGTYINFLTTAYGTINTIEGMRLDDSGALLIGLTARVGTSKLQVTGGASLDALTMTTAGNAPVTINGSGQPLVAPQGGTLIQAQGADAQNTRIHLDAVGNAFVGAIFLGRAASGTSAARARLLIDQRMVLLAGSGYGTSAYSASPRGTIAIAGAENWTDTAQGSYVAFNTTPVGGILTAETMRLDDSGALLIGLTARVGTSKLQVTGGAAMLAFGGVAPVFTSQVAMGTPAAPGTGGGVGSGNALFTFRGQGYGATNYFTGAGIQFITDETFTDAAHGTHIAFQTTAVGTGALVERMRITDAGALQFLAAGPSISVGAGAPAGNAAAGSIYIRTNGAASTRIYINQDGATSWLPIAGV
jgi:hypothetical protein